MRAFLRRLRARIKYRHFDRDLAREIETHRAMAEAELSAAGESAREARRNAARQLGNVTLATETSRATWIPRLLQELAQDARYAVRGMRRSPGFTAAAIVMLTLGLGLVSGGFTLFNGIFIRGWNVPDSTQVFRITGTAPTTDGREDGLSFAAFEYLRDHAQSTQYLAHMIGYFHLSDRADTRGPLIPGMWVSDNFLDVLQIPLQLGSGFAGRATGDVPIILSDGTWKRQFGADPAIIGRKVWILDIPSSVVGVTAPGFDGLAERGIGMLVPLTHATRWPQQFAASLMRDPQSCCMTIAGRRSADTSAARSLDEATLLLSQFRQSIGRPALSLTVRGTAPGTRGGVAVVPVLAAGVTLILLLTCANVGNLYLARSLRRSHEISVRLSLGASRARVVRQLVTEGSVLAMIAGALAFAVTAAVPALMQRLDASPTGAMFMPDWRVALLTALGVVVTCLLVAVAPALQASRVAGRGMQLTTTPGGGRTRTVVLATQIAIAAVLVLSALLVTRGVRHALNAPWDFALQTTTAARIVVPGREGMDQRSLVAANTAIRVALTQAVRASDVPLGLSTTSPANDHAGFPTSVQIGGVGRDVYVQLLPMSTGAFSVLHIPLREGRWAADDPAVQEAVINERLANDLWPNGNAVGHELTLSFDRKRYMVVGVAKNAHLVSLSEVGPMMHIAPVDNGGIPVILAETRLGLEERLGAMVKGIDPTLRVELTALSTSVRGTLDVALFGAAIAGSLGALALGLAIIGVFGVFSYLIEERRREIGIRLALGASRRQIRMALFSATKGAILGGITGGLMLSLIAGFALRAYLFGMSVADPMSYLAVAMMLIVSALIATAIPIRRAVRIDPAITLRQD